MKTFDWLPLTENGFWKSFNEQHKPEECLVVVRRANGKSNVGYVLADDNVDVSDGIYLNNGNWSIFIPFDDGPPKRYAILAPPEFKILNPDPALPLA